MIFVLQVYLYVPEHYYAKPGTERQALITRLIEYTSFVSDNYLRKLDRPCQHYEDALVIYQKTLPIESPEEIFKAISEASHQYQSCSDQGKRRSLRMLQRNINMGKIQALDKII